MSRICDPPRTGDDVVAELDAGAAQPADLGGQVVDDELDAVPTPGFGPLAIWHRPSRRTRRATQQEPERSSPDVREGWGKVGEKCEVQMLRVPFHGSFDIGHHVTDIDGCLCHFCLAILTTLSRRHVARGITSAAAILDSITMRRAER